MYLEVWIREGILKIYLLCCEVSRGRRQFSEFARKTMTLSCGHPIHTLDKNI